MAESKPRTGVLTWKPEPTKPRTVKVALYVVVEVDVDALEAEYGREFTNAEAKADAWESMYGAATTAAYPEHAQHVLKVISTNRAAR